MEELVTVVAQKTGLAPRAGAGSNPLLIIFETMFAFGAWRNAGWIGLDRFLLPRLGTP